MANFVSPGVYIVERDISDYVPTVNPTVVGIVGFANKGKPNKATLITSQENLIKEFGRPVESIPGQAIEGALEILETCNQLYFVRAFDAATGSDASAMIPMGACPALGVSSAGIGVTSSMYFRIQVTDNTGVDQFVPAKTFSVLAGTAYGDAGSNATTQQQAFGTILGGSLDSAKVGSYLTASGVDTTIPEVVGNYIVGNFAGSGSTLTVEAFGDAALTLRSPVLYPLDVSGNASGVSGVIPANATIGLAVGGGAGVAPMNSYTNSGIGGPSGVGFVSAVVRGVSFVNGSSTAGNGLGYLAQSLDEGAGYNLSTLANGTVIGNSITVRDLGSDGNTIQINDDGIAMENFKVSLVNSGTFVEDIINTGETNLKSNIIKGNLFSEGADIATITKLSNYTERISNLGTIGVVKGSKGAMTVGLGGGVASDTSAAQTDSYMDSRFNKFIGGTYGMFDGDNGFGADTDAETAALIGVTGPIRTGMQVLDDDLIPVTMCAVPGITTASVQNALITLAESTGDFLAVFGTPYGIGGTQDAIDYANGQTTYRSSPFNSSYAALYFPQVKVFQSYLAKDIWMDPAIFAIRQMGFTDTVADLWFAPAGFQRGRLTKPTDTEVSINRGDRDAMYSGGNCVNPIVNFAQQGITIFGQRTTQRSPTALDRINVRRLMIYVKRVIQASTERFIFEPNDPITQEAIENLLKPTFQDIKQRRGITAFKVICDESVNTPVRVDRNELWCKIIIKPTKTAEILVFELNITNQSAEV